MENYPPKQRMGGLEWSGGILLMVQKSHSQPPGMYKNLVNNGMNYTPENEWMSPKKELFQ